MARAALVGAADFNIEHFASQYFDKVIAVDGGYAACHEQGIEPDIVVGDFDSLGQVPTGDNVYVYPAIKDESDMELAMRLATGQECDELVLYGALSGRLDHTFANIQLMVGYARRGIRCIGVGDKFALVALSGDSTCDAVYFDAFDTNILDGSYGPYLSVFAVGGDARDVDETGLKYALSHAWLPYGVSLGLSNEFTGENASISVGQGSLLVSFALQAGDYLRFGCA